MKRQYVKPMMESEAFVANEYVAACYTVSCIGDGCGSFPGKWEGTEDSRYPAGLVEGEDGNAIYKGTMGSSDGCKKTTEYLWGTGIIGFINFIKDLLDDGELGFTTKFHPVSVTEGYYVDNKWHPNISI